MYYCKLIFNIFYFRKSIFLEMEAGKWKNLITIVLLDNIIILKIDIFLINFTNRAASITMILDEK